LKIEEIVKARVNTAIDAERAKIKQDLTEKEKLEADAKVSLLDSLRVLITLSFFSLEKSCLRIKKLC
jgi:hypothetical protein